MAERKRVSLFITPRANEKLRQMALDFGFPMTAGPGRGDGSLSFLMEAIAEGEILLARPPVAGRLLDSELQAIVAASVDATLATLGVTPTSIGRLVIGDPGNIG